MAGRSTTTRRPTRSIGNYNVLLSGCPAKLWDAQNTSWEESHAKWHTAFAAFPWELLEVFSGPPTVAFSWRHWANYTGTFEGHTGQGELVELYGFGVATVNDKLQLVDVDIYYKAEDFMEVMRGERPASDMAGAKSMVGTGCPVMGHKAARVAPPATTPDGDRGCAPLANTGYSCTIA